MPKKPSWNQQDMSDAYLAVTNKVLTLTEAAKTFNVPKSTLSDRVQGKTPVCTTIGNKTYLPGKNYFQQKCYYFINFPLEFFI